MPSSIQTNKRQRTAERALWIENAAIRCFLQKGYESSSISDIMAKANETAELNNVATVSDGAFYSLFDSKQAVIDTVLERDAKKLIAFISELIARPEFGKLELFDALESTHEALGSFYAQHKNYIAILFSISDLPAAFSSTRDYIGMALSGVVRGFLEKREDLEKDNEAVNKEDLEIIASNIVIMFEMQHRHALNVINDSDDNLLIQKSQRKWDETMRMISGYLKEYIRDAKTHLQPWENLAMLEFQASQQKAQPLSSYLFFHYHFRKLAQEDKLSLGNIQNLVHELDNVTASIKKNI